MYCVYVTTYNDGINCLKYVGSSSVKKIEEGYLGSVAPKEFKDLWNIAIQTSPERFSVEIVSLHDQRKDALSAELQFQIEHNVVRSSDWVNKSLAQPDGFFGMDVSGSANPMFGRSRKGEKHKGGENISSALQLFFSSDASNNHRNSSRSRMKLKNPASDTVVMDKIKSTWKSNNRNAGNKNGMFGKRGAMSGKILYNDGFQTKAFFENEQPDGWSIGRHPKT